MKYEFTTSKASQVKASEITTVTGEEGVDPRYGDSMFRFEITADTAFETDNTSKINQRTEITEQASSSLLNQSDDTLYYGFSVYIDPITQIPTAGVDGESPALIFTQFHDTSPYGDTTVPPIVFLVNDDGDIEVRFAGDLGGDAFIILDGGKDGEAAKGQWIDFVVAADWSVGDDGSFELFMDTGDGYEQVIDHEGANTLTGQVYTKFGLYRTFIERNPEYAETDAIAYFDGIRRTDSLDEVYMAPVENGIGSLGEDNLMGDRDDNYITGGAGDDLLNGGSGNDYLFGGNDDDELIGGRGEDHLYGDNGTDALSGGSGNDYLDGGYGADLLNGGIGDDYLSGGNGTDFLDGGTGSDFLDGGANGDTLSGGNGADVLVGGGSNDILTGGRGADTFLFHADEENGNDVVTDFEAQLDTLQFLGSNAEDTSMKTIWNGEENVVRIYYSGGSVTVNETDHADIWDAISFG